MLKGRSTAAVLTGLLLVLALWGTFRMDAAADETQEDEISFSVGIAQIIDPSAGYADKEKIEELAQSLDAGPDELEEESDLVMVNVQQAMNVRAEASEDSDKVGVLYKDCGGRILERKDGWTRLKSGDLIGWASDEYLLFGEEAEAMADEVGNLIVTIDTEILRVRDGPSTDADVIGLLTADDEFEIIDFVDDDWISVDYKDETGYVSTEFVSIDFHIDEGETLAAIRQREEEERKAKLNANQGAVVVGGDDLRLLAALIHCEAGSETYNGKLAVGAVVMNRVRSGAYPNTISGVIFASGQFTPALSGKVARVYTSGNIAAGCYEAAQAAINGETNVGSATHFRRAGNHDGIQIDNQVFW